MSRVIQITVSIKGSLFALTDDGDIYVRTRRSPWKKVDSPVPPRFSLPEEYEPAPCQSSASGESFAADKQCDSRLHREHVIPDLIAMQMPERPRRPTTIESDGNYGLRGCGIPFMGDELPCDF